MPILLLCGMTKCNKKMCIRDRAEDGNLKFIKSLTSVGTEYDNVRGKAKAMFDQTTTPMQEMEANTRQLQMAPVSYTHLSTGYLKI